MSAMKPVDQPRRIADEISDQIAALFNGDLSHGKSIAEIVERALTQPKADSTSAPAPVPPAAPTLEEFIIDLDDRARISMEERDRCKERGDDYNAILKRAWENTREAREEMKKGEQISADIWNMHFKADEPPRQKGMTQQETFDWLLERHRKLLAIEAPAATPEMEALRNKVVDIAAMTNFLQRDDVVAAKTRLLRIREMAGTLLTTLDALREGK